MSIATTTHPATSNRAVAGIGLTSALVATAGTLFGAHDWREVGVVVGVIALTTALVYGVVVPRALRKESAGGTALALSIPAALLLLPAFWAGIPFVLGTAGAVVGNAGRNARTGAVKSIVGAVLGALAAVAYVAIYVSDGMNGGAGFLFD